MPNDESNVSQFISTGTYTSTYQDKSYGEYTVFMEPIHENLS